MKIPAIFVIKRKIRKAWELRRRTRRRRKKSKNKNKQEEKIAEGTIKSTRKE